MISGLWAIARREIQAYFASPVAYVVLAFFVFLYGYVFVDYLSIFVQQSMGGGFGGGAMNLNQDLIRWLFSTTAVILLFVLPLVTMRSFSEELRAGTIELLLTSPVTDWQLVLGKFLGAFFLYATMLGLTTIHMGVLFFFGDPEWKPLLAGYLGMLLLGAGFLSFGLLYSSLTKNQIVAGFLSFGTFLFLWLIQFAESWAGEAAGVISYVSATSHLEEFVKGVIDTRDVVYYLSFTALGLFLARQSIQSLRYRG